MFIVRSSPCRWTCPEGEAFSCRQAGRRAIPPGPGAWPARVYRVGRSLARNCEEARSSATKRARLDSEFSTQDAAVHRGRQLQLQRKRQDTAALLLGPSWSRGFADAVSVHLRRRLHARMRWVRSKNRRPENLAITATTSSHGTDSGWAVGRPPASLGVQAWARQHQHRQRQHA